MYLKSLKLWNFRKFGSSDELIGEDKKLRSPDLSIFFNKGMNVLIGENDSGKTAIIDAIKIILKTHAPEWIQLKQDDFYNGTNNLRIECCFEELGSVASHFIEWLGFDEDNLPFLKIHIQAKKNDESVFFYDVKAGADEEGLALSAEAKEKLKAVYLKPLRDAKSELIPKKNSRLSQILQGHETFKGQEKTHKLLDFFEKLERDINRYFEVDVEGKKPKKGVEEILDTFFKENKTINFSVTNKNEIKEVLEILKIALEDEKMGLGSHNLLFMATELLNLKRTKWDGIRLGLIEELEAHLHPQAQMRVIESLQEESKNGNGIQFILTTHSPNIGSKLKIQELFICEEGQVFSLREGETKLDETDYNFLERFLDVTKANLFFANGVILVEGWSEEILIPVLAKKIGINLTKKGVSIVNVAGTSFLRYAKIFQRNDVLEIMRTPISIVTDSDIYPNMESDDKEKYDKQVLSNETVNGYKGQSVEVFMSRDEDWTLEWLLFRSDLISGLFKQATRKVHSGTSEFKETATIPDFNQKLEAKLKDKSFKKVEIATELAKLIDESDIDLINDESEEIKYLLNSIKYASGELSIPKT